MLTKCLRQKFHDLAICLRMQLQSLTSSAEVASLIKSTGFFQPNIKEIKARLDSATQNKSLNLETFSTIVNKGTEVSLAMVSLVQLVAMEC